MDECAAASDEIPLRAHCVIPITREAHEIQLCYWIKTSIGYHIYICMQMSRKKDIWISEWFYYDVVDKYEY